MVLTKKRLNDSLKYLHVFICSCPYQPASNKHDGLLDYQISVLVLINQRGCNLISVLAQAKPLLSLVLHNTFDSTLLGCAIFNSPRLFLFNISYTFVNLLEYGQEHILTAQSITLYYF